MNTAHWHLLLNHLPIEGTIIATFILATGIFLKNPSVIFTGLFLFIITGLFAFLAYLTGDGAEEILTSIGQKNEYYIHKHEELAEKAFWVAEVIAILAVVAFISLRRQSKNSRLIIVIVLFAGIANSILMTVTGNAGGQIRHTEVRSTNDSH